MNRGQFFSDPGSRMTYQHPLNRSNPVDQNSWRISPVGAQRVQSGKKPAALSQGEWEILTNLAELGVADEEELQFESRVVYHPRRIMKRLQDLGYVMPVVPPTWEQLQQPSLPEVV